MIRLVVGLGNPGSNYADTRHNAGVWFLQRLAQRLNSSLKPEKKFQGELASCPDPDLKLLFPTTFMNLSGHSVASVMQFYKIPPEQVLIAHDELDLPLGSTRLKLGGGTGGHNGLKSIMESLGGAQNFYRLRIGIGHPGDRSRVLDFVLHKTPSSERQIIEDALDQVLTHSSELLQGDIQRVMQQLHTPSSSLRS